MVVMAMLLAGMRVMCLDWKDLQATLARRCGTVFGASGVRLVLVSVLAFVLVLAIPGAGAEW